jgi:hypothetical protein
VLILGYASAPWLVAGWAKRTLAGWDLEAIQVRAGYPGWHGLTLHKVQFTTTAVDTVFRFQFTDVEIEYRIPELLTGTVARIRLPAAMAEARPETDGVVTSGAGAAQAIAALVSGQWLSDWPVREVFLKKLTIDGRGPAASAYTVELAGHIRDAALTLNGTLALAAPTPGTLPFSIYARDSGEARLALMSSTKSPTPMLELNIDEHAIDRAPTTISGALHAKPGAVAASFKPWLGRMEWVAVLDGELDTRWQAALPARTDDGIALTLSQLKLGAADWELAGEARVHGLAAPSPTQPLSVQLIQAGGHYRKLVLTGARGNAVIARDDGVRTTGDAQIHVDLLDVGFPIRNIDARFRLLPKQKIPTPVLRIEQVGAELLGGKARSGPVELDFGKSRQQFVVELEGIGLNDIMQLERQEGLHGTGVLDGRLPIEITRAGVRVTQGTLTARAPGGEVRFQPTEKVASLVQTNPNLKMVVDALGNFRYHKLQVTSDYRPEGNLTLAVQLEGQNPDWQSGRPVNLNLNLDENIPALLRSLQLSGEITERVRKRYDNAR